MAIIPISEFKFSQYFVQDNGGWCGGISVALITHLYENLDDGYRYISPDSAFDQAKTYVSILRASFNKATGRATAGTSSYRRQIWNQQRPFNFGGGSGPAGTYEYSFSSPGTALLRLQVTEPAPNGGHGGSFASWYTSSLLTSANHAGMVTWRASKVFLFDPNCGGILYSWNTSGGAGSFEANVDLALDRMYGRYDRKQGARSARVVDAKKLDPTQLPYGQV